MLSKGQWLEGFVGAGNEFLRTSDGMGQHGIYKICYDINLA
jgi:hypothetical protein